MRKNIGLTQNNGTWSYTRMVPKACKNHPAFKGKANYRVQLGPVSLPEEQLDELYRKTHRSFESFIKLLNDENKDVLDKNSLIGQAEAFLDVYKLKKGMLAYDDMLTKTDNDNYLAMQKFRVEQTGAFDEMFHYSNQESYHSQGGEVTHNQLHSGIQVQEYAWKLLTEPKSANTKKHLISESWPIYATQKGLDEDKHETRRVRAMFQKFVGTTGDHIFDEDILEEALVAYVDKREQERAQNLKKQRKASPSPSTIDRELSAILCILRVAIRKLRLKIKLERPQVKNDIAPKERHTFTAEEQLEVIKQFSDITRRDHQPYKELLALLMVQSGTHISELIRLSNDRVKIEHNIPHIIIDGELKTKQRRRIIPLVYKVDRIKELAEKVMGAQYLFGDNLVARQAENYSILMNRVCKSVHPEATTYSFRHSFKHHAMAHGIDALLMAALGGWSGKELGLSRQMIGYGASGMLNNESLKRLRDAMLTINKHLLDADKLSEDPEGHSKLSYLHQRQRASL